MNTKLRLIAVIVVFAFITTTIFIPTYSGDIKSAKLAPQSRFAGRDPSLALRMTAAFSSAGLADEFRRMADTLLPHREEQNIFESLPEGEVGVIEIGVRRLNKEFFERMINSNPDTEKQMAEYLRAIDQGGSRRDAEIAQLKLKGKQASDKAFDGKVSELEQSIIWKGINEKWFSLAEVMRRVHGRSKPPKVVAKVALQVVKKKIPAVKPKKVSAPVQPITPLADPAKGGKVVEDERAFLDGLDDGIAAPENRPIADDDVMWLKDFINDDDEIEETEEERAAEAARRNKEAQEEADREWDARLKASLEKVVAEVEAAEKERREVEEKSKRQEEEVERQKREAEAAKRAEIERARKEAEGVREKEKADLDQLLREFRENAADQKNRMEKLITMIEEKQAEEFIDSTIQAIDTEEGEAAEFIENLLKDLKKSDEDAQEALIKNLLYKKNSKQQVLQALLIEVNRHRNKFSDVKDIAGRIENLKSGLVEASQALVVSAAEKKNILARIASNKERLARMAEDVRKALRGLRQLSGRIEALNAQRLHEKEFGKVHRDLREELLKEQGKRQRKDALLEQKDTQASGIFDEQANLEKGLGKKEEEINKNINTLERLLDEEVMALRQEAGNVMPEMAEKTDEMIVAGALETLEKEELAPQDKETDSVVGVTEDAFHRNNDLAEGIGRSLERGELDSKANEVVAGRGAWVGALDKLIVASKGGEDRERLRSLRDRIDSACDEIAGDRAELEQLRNRLKNELMLMLEALKRARRIEKAQAQRRAQMEENKKRRELEAFEKALRKDRAALQGELNELENLKRLEDQRMERLKNLEALMNARKKNIESNTALLGELTQQVDSERKRKEEEETREEERQISSETDAIEKALGEEAGSKDELGKSIRKILLKKNGVPDWGSFKAEFITLLREVRENIQKDAELDKDLTERGPRVMGVEQGIKSRVEGIRHDIERRGVKERIRFGRKFTELDEAEKNARRSGLKSGLCDEVERANVERISARNRWKTKIKDVITTISEADEAGFGQARRELVKLRGIAKDTKAWADEDGRRLTDLSEQERLLNEWNAEIDRIAGTVLADEAETKEPVASTPQLQATDDLLKKRERIAEMLSKLLEIPNGPFDISLGNPVKNLDKRRWLLPFSPARIKGMLSRNPGALLPALSDRFIYDLLSEIESKKQGSDEASTRRGYYREAGIDGELQERIEGFLREFGTAKDAHKGSRDDIAMEVALRLGITDAREAKRIKDLFVGFDGKLRRAIEYVGYEDRDSEREVLTELVAGIGSVAARTEEARIKFRKFLDEHKDSLTPSLIVIEGIGQVVPLAVTGKSGWLTRMIGDCESLIRKQSNVSTPTRERDYPSLELNDDERERLLSIIFGMQAQDLLFGEMNSIESLFGSARKVNMGWVRDALDFIKGSREAEERGEYREFKKDCVRQYKLSQKEAVVDRLYMKVRAMDGLALDLLEDYLERILKCPKSPVFVSGDVIKVLVLGTSEDITQGACLDMWKKEFGDDGKAMMEFAREEGYSELITRLRNSLRVDVEGETVFPSKAMLIEVLQIVLVGQKQDLNAVVRGLKHHLLKLKKRIEKEYKEGRLPHPSPINGITAGASRTAALAPASRFGDVPALSAQDEEAAKRLFVGALNHHMNQPIGAIYGFLPFIKEELDLGNGLDDKQVSEDLDKVINFAKKMREVIRLVEGIVNPVDERYDDLGNKKLDLEGSNILPKGEGEQEKQIREAKLRAIDELRKPLIAKVNKVLSEIEKELASLKEGKLDKAAALEALDRIRQKTKEIDNAVKAVSKQTGSESDKAASLFKKEILARDKAISSSLLAPASRFEYPVRLSAEEEQGLREKFVVALKHNINQPITVICSVIPRLQRWVEQGRGFDDGDVKEAFEDVRSSVKKARHIVQLIRGIVNPVDMPYSSLGTKMLDLERSNALPTEETEVERRIREAKCEAIKWLKDYPVEKIEGVLNEIDNELESSMALTSLGRIYQKAEEINNIVRAITAENEAGAGKMSNELARPDSLRNGA